MSLPLQEKPFAELKTGAEARELNPSIVHKKYIAFYATNLPLSNDKIQMK